MSGTSRVTLIPTTGLSHNRIWQEVSPQLLLGLLRPRPPRQLLMGRVVRKRIRHRIRLIEG